MPRPTLGTMRRDPGRVEEKAYAKINLRLKVEGRRGDGYHLLSMLNCLVDLHDTVKISPHADLVVRTTFDGDYFKQAVISDDPGQNLAGRAARCFFDAIDVQSGVHIDVIKRIPIGAGLGGGSSDAAAVLRALERLYPEKGITAGQLNGLAASLGADVPFFLGTSFAHVSGIGECVAPLSGSALSGWPCLLCIPPCEVNTRHAYGLLAQDQQFFFHVDIVGRRVAEAALRGDLPVAGILEAVENDFEGFVPVAFPPVARALVALRSYPRLAVGLSGSGSAIFVIPHDREQEVGALSSVVQELGCAAIVSSLCPMLPHRLRAGRD